MGDHLGYISLDSIVNDYLLESDQSVAKYYKCWHLAFRGMDDMGMDAFYRVQSVKLPIEENFTVKLPADYLNWTKVGILNDRGEIIPLYYNDKLTTYADLLPDRLNKTQDPQTSPIEWNPNLWVNYWASTGYTNVYGVPSGEPFVGSFKIDTENGVIVLNEQFRWGYLMLEYILSPLEGTDYKVPVQFREAILAWLWWKDKKSVNTKRGQVGISQGLKSDYFRERRNAIARWKPSRIYEKYQVSQEQTRLAVKT